MLSDPCRDVVVGELKARRESLIALGLVDRIQILALYVLDDCQLQHLAIVHLANDRWNRLQTRILGGAQAALARHELIATARSAPQQNGLENAGGLDGIRQLL